MELKVLGSVSPYVKGECNGPGFMITENNYKVMLDAGNGITRMLSMPNDLSNLIVFISHLHKDHYGELGALGYASYCYHNLGLLRDKILVYIPNGNCATNDDHNVISNIQEAYWKVEDINKNEYYRDKMKISFLRTNHYVVSYAIKVEADGKSIVYSGDIGYTDAEALINFSKDCDILICDSTFIREHNVFSNSHLHAYQAAEIARYAAAKKLLLTHFWPETPKEKYLEEAKLFFENTDVAIEGKQYVLGGK